MEAVSGPVTHKDEMLSWCSVQSFVNGDAAFGVAVIDEIPGFVTKHIPKIFACESMQSIPEQELCAAHQQDQPAELRLRTAQAFQAAHRDQNKQACLCSDVVRIEVWIEVSAQSEKH